MDVSLRTLVVFVFLSCSTFVAGGAALAASDPGLQPFERDVYPTLKKYCAQCHSSDASGPRGPDHADKDVGVAYPVFKRLVDFRDPFNSRIVKRIRNFHFCRDYGAWCGQEQQVQDELEPLVVKFLRENDPMPRPPSTTEHVATGDGVFTAHFDVLNSGASRLRISIMFSKLPNGNYEISPINASGESGTLRISQVHFLVNGRTFSQQTGLELIDTTHTFDAWPLASNKRTTIPLMLEKPQVAFQTGDKLSLSLAVQAVKPAACSNMRIFEGIVLSQLITGRLGEQSWIGLSNQQIKAILETEQRAALAERLCQAYEQRINPVNPARSVLPLTMTGVSPEQTLQLIDLWNTMARSKRLHFTALKVKDIVVSRNLNQSDTRQTAKCALTPTGDAHCWGYFRGLPEVRLGYDRLQTRRTRLSVPGPVKQVALGFSHYCVANEAGQVWCWGENQSSASAQRERILNDAPNAPGVYTAPARMSFFDRIAPDKVVQIATGATHTCGLTAAGRVYCFGSNFFGQLGLESPLAVYTPESGEDAPTAVPLREKMISIVAGAYSTCALSDSRQMYCWGHNVEGSLGTGDNGSGSGERARDNSPIIGTLAGSIANLKPVPVGEKIEKISGGTYTYCALTVSKKLYCFGRNDRGQVGHEQRVSYANVPGLVPLGTGAIDVSTQGSTTCALTDEGRPYCWGSQLTFNFADSSLQGYTVGMDRDTVRKARLLWSDTFKRIVSGGGESCAINAADELHCWENFYEGSGVDIRLFQRLRGRGIDLSMFTRVLLIDRLAPDAAEEPLSRARLFFPPFR